MVATDKLPARGYVGKHAPGGTSACRFASSLGHGEACCAWPTQPNRPPPLGRVTSSAHSLRWLRCVRACEARPLLGRHSRARSAPPPGARGPPVPARPDACSYSAVGGHGGWPACATLVGSHGTQHAWHRGHRAHHLHWWSKTPASTFAVRHVTTVEDQHAFLVATMRLQQCVDWAPIQHLGVCTGTIHISVCAQAGV